MNIYLYYNSPRNEMLSMGVYLFEEIKNKYKTILIISLYLVLYAL